MMQIQVLNALKDNYVYVVTDGERAAVIDPGEAAVVIQHLKSENLQLSHILCTHHHHDHVGGVKELARAGVEVWGSTHDAYRLPVCTQGFSDGDVVHCLGQAVHVLHLPGHTLGQVAYWWPSLKAVFVGDTLFSAGCGRLFEGSAEQMHNSLQRLCELPPDTDIYFGHEYTAKNLAFVAGLSLPEPTRREVKVYSEQCRQRARTTPVRLEQELKINPFLQCRDSSEFAELRAQRDRF